MSKVASLYEQRKTVMAFSRGKRFTTFVNPLLGRVVAPPQLIGNQRQARVVAEALAGKNLQLGQVIAFNDDAGRAKSLKIEKIWGAAGLVLSEQVISGADQAAYILPEDGLVQESLFRRVAGKPREYYFDSITIQPPAAGQISKVEIDDPVVAAFVKRLLARGDQEVNYSYKLVYHNYRDADDGGLKLKADAIVLIVNAKRGRGKPPITYVFVQKCSKSILLKLPMEMVLEEHPDQVVASADQVKLSQRLYNEVYRREALPADELPIEEFYDLWPYDFPKTNLMALRDPALSIREKWQLYWAAVRKDGIFGSTAVGSLLESSSRGLVEGALLYSIYEYAQDELKVAALLGILAKCSPAFHLLANNFAAGIVEKMEAREGLGKVLNKLFPLWEIAEMKKSTSILLDRYRKISLAYLLTTSAYLFLFPVVFKSIMGGRLQISPLVFVAGYLAAEFMTTMADAFDAKNLFKIGENRLRFNDKLPELKKRFWTIDTFHDNLALALNQGCFYLGLGINAVLSLIGATAEAAVGIGLGAIALLVAFGRFLITSHIREEKSRLIIGSSAYLRYGQSLNFSDSVNLAWDDPKIEIIDEEGKNRVTIPDFGPGGARILLSGDFKISQKSGWWNRLMPFAARTTFRIATGQPADPIIEVVYYGPQQSTAADVEKFIYRQRSE